MSRRRHQEITKATDLTALGYEYRVKFRGPTANWSAQQASLDLEAMFQSLKANKIPYVKHDGWLWLPSLKEVIYVRLLMSDYEMIEGNAADLAKTA